MIVYVCGRVVKKKKKILFPFCETTSYTLIKQFVPGIHRSVVQKFS